MKPVKFGPMVIWAITSMALLFSSSGALATDLTSILDTSGPGLTVVQAGVGLEDLTSATTGGGSIPLTITINGTVDKAFLYWAGRDFRPCTDANADCVLDHPATEAILINPFRDQVLKFGVSGGALTPSMVLCVTRPVEPAWNRTSAVKSTSRASSDPLSVKLPT